MVLAADGTSTDSVSRIGLPDIERLEQRELVAVRADELGELEQDALAVGRRLVGPAPVIERRRAAATARSMSSVPPSATCVIDRAVAAGDVVERPAGRRRHEPAIDERLVAWRDRGGPREPVGRRRGSGGGARRSCRVPRDRGLVERGAKAGPLRHTEEAVGVGPDRLGEEGVTALRRPARAGRTGTR